MATVQVSKGEMEPSNEKQDLPSSEVSQDYKLALYNKASSSKFADPCEKARQDSMTCLNVNSYDKAACADYFRAFRECKKTWYGFPACPRLLIQVPKDEPAARRSKGRSHLAWHNDTGILPVEVGGNARNSTRKRLPAEILSRLREQPFFPWI